MFECVVHAEKLANFLNVYHCSIFIPEFEYLCCRYSHTYSVTHTELTLYHRCRQESFI